MGGNEMREIKFRGWYGSKLGMMTPSFNGDINEIFALKHGEYMQFAGLKDCNGVEIYEGDAIFWEIDNGVGIESYSAVVYYSENTEKYKGMYKWIVVYLGDFHRGEFDELRTPSRYKDSLQVFGNIYENPELLTEK
ncbi:hypothetical protein COL97_01470 [Bacillus safensis]|nr:hypothetical protein COL97_01470 [Bacillus safensis]